MRSFQEQLRHLTESPSTVDLSTLYDQLNRDLFGGALMDVPIKFGKAPKGAAGVTTYSITRKPGMPNSMKYHGATTNLATIQVIIQTKAWTDIDKLKGVVAHEMCHVACAQNSQVERDAHGVYFQSWRRKAQQNAPFDIPLQDDSSHEEYEDPKPVMFMVGLNYTGKYVVWLYRPTLAQRPDQVGVARINCDRLIKARFKWALIGTAKTNLANTMSVSREIKGPGNNNSYVLQNPKELHIQQIFHTEGPVDHSIF